LRIWEKAKDWLGTTKLHSTPTVGQTFLEWWNFMSLGQNRKGVASLAMLILWEVWKERNNRVFNNKRAPSQVVFDRVKTEARLWMLAGAKNLGNLMPGE
jgi:hypothetical protein